MCEVAESPQETELALVAAVAEGLRRLTGPEGETFSAGARALSAAYTWPERAAALEATYLKAAAAG